MTTPPKQTRAPGGGRKTTDPEPADHVIHLRVTRSRKNSYVRAARATRSEEHPQGLKLSEWMQRVCDPVALETLGAD